MSDQHISQLEDRLRGALDRITALEGFILRNQTSFSNPADFINKGDLSDAIKETVKCDLTFCLVSGGSVEVRDN